MASSGNVAACIAIAIGTALLLTLLLGWNGHIMPGVLPASPLLVKLNSHGKLQPLLVCRNHSRPAHDTHIGISLKPLSAGATWVLVTAKHYNNSTAAVGNWRQSTQIVGVTAAAAKCAD